MSPDRSTLLFAVSHFDNAAEVRRFVAHVAERGGAADLDVRIGVCDNSLSWPNDLDLPPSAFVVRPDANLGYLGGARFVLRHWLQTDGTPTWLAISNTDLVLDDDALTQLAALNEDAGVVAPDVRLPDGRAQNPFLETRYSRLRAYAYVWITRFEALLALMTRTSRLRRRLRRAMRSGHAPADASRVDRRGGAARAVYAPHGSIVFIGKRFFDLGGSLEFDAFMYGEEIHLAEQARAVGCPVTFVPSIGILHEEHAVIGSVASELRRRWLNDSARVVWQRYFAPAWWPRKRTTE